MTQEEVGLGATSSLDLLRSHGERRTSPATCRRLQREPVLRRELRRKDSDPVVVYFSSHHTQLYAEWGPCRVGHAAYTDRVLGECARVWRYMQLRRPRPKWPWPRHRSGSLPRRRTQNRPTRGKLSASRFP